MLFNSYAFVLAFLPLSLGGFFAAARLAGPVAAGCWLVGASLVFYGWWNPGLVPLLLASMAGNYIVARLIARMEAFPRWQTALLGLGIGADIAALIYYKYLASVLGYLRAHVAIDVAFADPVLPLGISFFTFTQIGFLIDCRQGLARDRGLLHYALFVTFFPHLIAGPILHHREIMPQFADRPTYRARGENIAVGLGIFLIGLLKKCLFADALSPLAAAGFAYPADLAFFSAWETALAYSLQLYFDFSGYSDMAIGIARMFNLRFPANFNSPYKAESVIDYWQRWHMTLTRYLMLYLYNPVAIRIARRRAASGIGANRAAQATIGGFGMGVLLPTFLTMTLAGVWHGSGVTFLIFGLLHASYLSINHAWRIFRPPAWKPGRGVFSIAGRVSLTYLCVLVGAVMFRATSVADALQILRGMAGLHGVSPALGDARSVLAAARDCALIGTLFVIVWAAPNTQQIMRDYAPVLGRASAGPVPRLAWRPSVGWAVAFGGAGALGLLGIGGTGEFLYFQF